MTIEYASSLAPLPGEQLCGDIVWIKQFNNHLLLCLIDVAGHGTLAFEMAKECIPILEKYYQNPLVQIVQEIECYLQGKSRGLVIGLMLVETTTGLINYVGIGNISARIIGEQNYRFVSRSGTVGFSKTRPILDTHFLRDRDIILLYSDGIKNHFEITNFPEITTLPIEEIPTRILEMFSKKTDDSSCIAARYHHD